MKQTSPLGNIYPKKREFLILLLLGIILSIIVHFFILKKIGSWEIASFNPNFFDHVIPRRLHIERVEIDPNLFQESKQRYSSLKPVEIILSEKNKFSKEDETSQSYSNLKPGTLNSLNILEEKPQAVEHLIPEGCQKTNEPSISFDEETGKEGILQKNLLHKQTEHIGNYSQLDELIEQKKPLTSQTAPILLPTDLLFEYDADRLKPDAEKSLEKLAILIQHNPKAQFTIEGFTDSFGSDEYNLNLSSRRAECIKQWLIEKQSINKNQIQAVGLGKSHFLVPGTGSIQEQKLNRRVEIVIH